MKKPIVKNLSNPNDEHRSCWAPTDSNGNILSKQTIHLRNEYPKDGRTWVLIPCSRHN